LTAARLRHYLKPNAALENPSIEAGGAVGLEP
jgi:hypothetical protein